MFNEKLNVSSNQFRKFCISSLILATPIELSHHFFQFTVEQEFVVNEEVILVGLHYFDQKLENIG